jgi:undecaprenyl pyrophosphate phosphatase UppP
MNPVLRGLKATYNFFAGDMILLVATAVAFVLGLLLVHTLKAPNALVAIVFVGCIVGGLALTLGRELRGRERQR